MSWLGRKTASFLWWTYPRGSLEYDIMVGIILAFIFFTPRKWMGDQPRPGSVSTAFARLETSVMPLARNPGFAAGLTVLVISR